AGSVTSLTINVPHKDDGSGGEKNGAVTDLGFRAQNGSPQKSSAGGAFIRDAKLSGEITISAPTITASASLGFIGVSATGTASLVADASLSLVSPVDGGTQIPLSILLGAVTSGKFLFHDADKGLDSNGKPKTGPITGDISGAAGIELSITPTGALSGISGALHASGAISLDVPSFLTAPPQLFNYYDPLGFGHGAVTFADTVTPVALDAVAPANGQLTQDLFFIISNGGSEAIAVVKASDTASNNSLSDLITKQ